MMDKVGTTLVVFLALGIWTQTRADTLPIDELPIDREVLFSRDVAPVLKTNCVACHNARNAEGGVNLESAEQMKSSDVEDLLVPGKPDTSRLFLLASHADEPVMPPDDNDVSASNLNAMELALLRRWIESGAVVDQASIEATDHAWQPLPSALQTVYGSAMTADGRLSAISFGNRIQMFGAKSGQSVGALEIEADNQTKPAHEDFVQDLWIDSTGHHVVSAGFRNVKFWELVPFESALLPQFSLDDVLAIAINGCGDQLAVLSRRGELSVGEIGTDRWKWMKSFDIPLELVSGDQSMVQLSVGVAGHQAAIAWGNTIRIVRIDGKEPQAIDADDAITSMIWRGQDQLATADTTGHVLLWKRDGNEWKKTKFAVFDQAVLGLYSATQDPSRLVAIDVSGRVANWNETTGAFDKAGKLPSPAVSASLSPTGTTLWMTSKTGTLGHYRIADQKYVEVAKSDPIAEAQLARDNWETLVGEKLVTMHDKDVKQAEANVIAETKSIETFAKEIESKTKQRDEKQASIVEAKRSAEAAAAKLAEAKSAEQTSNLQRIELAESVKQLGAKVSELEKQLEKLKQEQTDAKKQLAAIPDAKKLADAIKAATEAATKADQVANKADSEFESAVAALRLAEATKVRGESRLKDLNAEQQRHKQVLEQIKADHETRKSNEAASKLLRDQSLAADQTLAVMSAGTRIVTRGARSDGGTTDTWSLWSSAGDWLAAMPGMPAGGKLIAAGDNCLIIEGADGNTHALNSSDRLWQHRKAIGTSTGKSPFADRVLCVDINPTGNVLATGGGDPSRSGELMLWKVSDGSLIRKIENSHSDTVFCVRFSPDGKTLATGGADRMIKLWDVETGKLIKAFEGHTHHVTAIAWNVNLRQLASGSADATVKVWDIGSGQSTQTISGLKSEVTGLVFVGREDRIGVVGGDGYFRVYRTDNGARETNSKVPGGYLYALDSNRDGSQFIVGGADGVAVIVDKAGKQLLEYSGKAD
ncbi:WD40 domain-containing protein [Rubripirellula reticaptiva]|uniref:Chromosome partition protein Smc n=1 Tax=Rubripirellula reticaptiva TaxID=2528013 RepID=A0A5C6EGA1_9BACT|nr:c-type cytochrome domain-containing protein [Rubripirellula reticaptiva]TWU46781.1 Chromosome partition protein Smc [Rubripirellula reticaptiva]